MLVSTWLIVYCFLHALSLFSGHVIVQTPSVTFLVYSLIITICLISLAILEVKWAGIGLEEWCRNEKFWLISGIGAHWAAVVQGLPKVISGIDLSFTLRTFMQTCTLWSGCRINILYLLHVMYWFLSFLKIIGCYCLDFFPSLPMNFISKSENFAWMRIILQVRNLVKTALLILFNFFIIQSSFIILNLLNNFEAWAKCIVVFYIQLVQFDGFVDAIWYISQFTGKISTLIC